jgi:predicted transcriptional regulator
MADSDTMHATSIRIPDDLREQVTRRAADANRSFSKEIVWVLRQYYDAHPTDTKSTKRK